MLNKYFKPTSLTWLASVTPLLLGLIAALAPLHGQEALAQSIGALTGGASPYELINAGLIGIGLRGAIQT